MKQSPALFAFNRGLVSVLALARVDQKRLAMSAEVMNNMLSRVLGPMIFRPGLAYKGGIASNNLARNLKFVFGTSDVALVELTDSLLRVWIADALLTRPAVTSAVTNGTFAGNIAGWTDGSDGGASATYEATNHLKLVSNGTARAIAYQAVTTSSAGTEHALRIVVTRGPVTLRVGNALADDSYVGAAVLDTGTHSISFTPSGTYYIQFQSTQIPKVLLTQCTVEGAGVMTLPAPWLEEDIGNVRYDQSADVLFCACDAYQQYKIERRGTRPNARSWSVVVYETSDGPFNLQNVGPNTIAASATTGNVTLTALQPLFKSGHVNGLFSITTRGQSKTVAISAQNTFSGSVLVTGISRSLGVTITGTFTGTTVTLQRSTDNANWADVAGQTWTAAVTGAYDDVLLNQSIYYRIGVKTGDYTGPDAIDATLIFSAGSQRGIVRITAVTDSTHADAAVLFELGGTGGTDIWQEGMWSQKSGFPTCVRLHEGRLWWFGRNNIWGSVSDSYYSHDETVTGESGPINRTVGSGPVDVINFALSLARLMFGSEGKEMSARSSALNTPLTPTDFNIKDSGNQGSANVEAWKIDQKGIFVHRNGIKVYELIYDIQSDDHTAGDLTQMVPELCAAGIVRTDVQRQPDTRIHCVLADGTAVVSVYSRAEDVLAWHTVSTDGFIEDVCVLPSESRALEDRVYYIVRRTVNGATVRYLERWSEETECRAGDVSKNCDSHVEFSGVHSTVIGGFSHLIGEDVVVWADGAPFLDTDNNPKRFTVDASGFISVDRIVINGAGGLYYEGTWQSTKLGMAQSAASSLFGGQMRITKLGLMLAYFHRNAILFGPDFTHMDPLPKVESGTSAPAVQARYDKEPFMFPSTWDADARLCLKARAPMSVTAMAAVTHLDIG